MKREKRQGGKINKEHKAEEVGMAGQQRPRKGAWGKGEREAAENSSSQKKKERTAPPYQKSNAQMVPRKEGGKGKGDLHSED